MGAGGGTGGDRWPENPRCVKVTAIRGRWNRDPSDLATWRACGNGIQYRCPWKKAGWQSREGMEGVGMLIVTAKLFRADRGSRGL